jgi:hypothetical protein
MAVAATPNGSPASTQPRLTRAESNRLNAQKSTGPRTAAGKERSKFNALKHGMRAETVVLPGEDAGEYEARHRQFHDDLTARNPVEAQLIDCMVDDTWAIQRIKSAARAQLAHTLRNQPIEQSRAERVEVIECSRRLLKGIAVPMACLPEDREGGPGHPGRLVVALEATVGGCDWLLGRFRQIEKHLRGQEIWRDQDGYELIRLMGYEISEAIIDDSAALLLLASQCVIDESRPPIAADDSEAEEDDDDEDDDEEDDEDDEDENDDDLESMTGAASWEEIGDRLQRTSRLVVRAFGSLKLFGEPINDARLRVLVPSHVTEARRHLAEVIEQATQRLEQVRAVRVEVAEANAADAPARLACDRGREGYLERRYFLAHRRLLLATVSQFFKVRKAGEDTTTTQFDFDPTDPTDPTDRIDPVDRCPTVPLSETSPPRQQASESDASPSRQQAPEIDTSQRRQHTSATDTRQSLEEPTTPIPAFLDRSMVAPLCAHDGCGNDIKLPNEAKLNGPSRAETAEPNRDDRPRGAEMPATASGPSALPPTRSPPLANLRSNSPSKPTTNEGRKRM